MIRKFIEQDRESYIEMSCNFYDSTAVSHPIPKENFVKTFNECLNGNPYCDGVAVVFQDKLVGFGLFSHTYSNEAGGRVIWLDELFILPQYRSCGLGKEFFDYIFKTYPDTARYRLEATRENQRAIALYKRLGFKDFDYLQFIMEKK